MLVCGKQDLFVQIKELMRFAAGFRFNESKCLPAINHYIWSASKIVIKRLMKTHPDSIPSFGGMKNQNILVADFPTKVLSIQHKLAMLDLNGMYRRCLQKIPCSVCKSPYAIRAFAFQNKFPSDTFLAVWHNIFIYEVRFFCVQRSFHLIFNFLFYKNSASNRMNPYALYRLHQSIKTKFERRVAPSFLIQPKAECIGQRRFKFSFGQVA